MICKISVELHPKSFLKTQMNYKNKSEMLSKAAKCFQ